MRSSGRGYKTCCSAEAIEEAEAGSTSFNQRKRAFRAFHWAAGLDYGWGSIVNWNDAPERTHAEVLATFNLAIALERNMPRDD